MVKTEQELTTQAAYSREFCAKYFGRNSSAKLAAELMKTDPETYRAVRTTSVQYGLVDAPYEAPLAKHYREQAAKNAPRSYSDAELLARAAYSEDECRALLTRTGNEGNANNLTKLAENPAEYAKFKTAAISYGLLPASAPRQEKAPTLQEQLQEKYSDAHLIAISDSLADSLRLPRGTKVEPERLSSLIEMSSSIEAARAEAASQENK